MADELTKDDFDFPEDEWYNYEKGYFVNPWELIGTSPDRFHDIDTYEEYLEKYPAEHDREAHLQAAQERQEEYLAKLREQRREAELEQDALEEQKKQERWRDATHDRPDATVGDLTFEDDFSNPDIDITHDRQTAEHEVVSGFNAGGDNVQYVVQTIGRKPPEIKINGWVTERQLSTVDNLVNQPSIEVITDRWTGVAVPLNVDIPYDRTFHERHGRIYEVTIELVGVQNGLPSNTEE